MPNQEQCFRAYLSKQTTRRKGVDTSMAQGTIDNCIRFVSDASDVNVFFHQSGILPKEETVLTTNAATLEEMAAYWLSSDYRAQLNAANRSAMNHYFKWRGINPKAIKQSMVPSSDVPPIPKQYYKKPHHNVRFFHILQHFCGKKQRGQASQPELYTRFLTGLFGEYNVYLSTEYNASDFQEHTPNSNTFFARCLAYFAEETNEEGQARHDRLLAAYPDLLQRCHAVAWHITETSGVSILEDMGRRCVSYDDALLSPLEALYVCQTTEQCSIALTALIKQILMDWDSSPSAFNEGIIGQALNDPRLYTGQILPHLLHQKNSPSQLVELMIHLPLVANSIPLQRLSSLYIALYSRVKDCSQALSVIPADALVGNPASTLYNATLHLKLAQTAQLIFAQSKKNTADMIRLDDAEVATKNCLMILNARSAAGQAAVDLSAGKSTMHCLYIEAYIMQISLYREWAQCDERTTSLMDFICLYIDPTWAAICNCRDRIARLNDASMRTAFLEQLDAYERKSFAAFFTQTSTTEHLVTSEPDARAIYDAARIEWLGDVCNQSVQSNASIWVPTVHRVLTTEERKEQFQFQPVYSGVYDSALCHAEGQQREVEKNLFRTLSHTQIPLLQFNQVCDNSAILKLFQVSGFRLCCRQGLIVASGYGSLSTPLQYLINRLENKNHKFSSTAHYDLDSSRSLSDLNQNNRTVMINRLKRTSNPLSFSTETRDEMERLLDTYRWMEDSFLPVDLRHWHQGNPNNRPASNQPKVKLEHILSHQIQQWLQDLRADLSISGSNVNEDLLNGMEGYAARWQHLTSRSAYHAEIAKTYASDPITLDLFKKLVDISYHISNGHQSCDNILLTQMDVPTLRPRMLSSNIIQPDKQSAQSLELIIAEHDQPTSTPMVTWSSIFELGINVRLAELAERKATDATRARERARFAALERSSISIETTDHERVESTTTTQRLTSGSDN